MSIYQPTRRQMLTPKQAEVLEFIRGMVFERGFPPSAREIGTMLGVSSTNAVSDHLIALEKKGFIERSPGIARGIRLI